MKVSKQDIKRKLAKFRLCKTRQFFKIFKDIDITVVLGEGIYGVTFLATYQGQIMCVKLGKSVEIEEFFRCEAMMLDYLDGHGGMPRLYASASDFPLIVMEYINGYSLYDVLHNPELIEVT